MYINLPAEWGMFTDAGIGDPRLPQNTGEGKDYARYAPTTAKRLTDAPEAGGATLPDGACYALISIQQAPIRYRTSMDTDATADEGLYLPAGTLFFPPGRAFLEAFSFIDTAEGASEVTIHYGR